MMAAMNTTKPCPIQWQHEQIKSVEKVFGRPVLSVQVVPHIKRQTHQHYEISKWAEQIHGDQSPAIPLKAQKMLQAISLQSAGTRMIKNIHLSFYSLLQFQSFFWLRCSCWSKSAAHIWMLNSAAFQPRVCEVSCRGSTMKSQDVVYLLAYCESL